MDSTITIEQFVKAVKEFQKISDAICDGWVVAEKDDKTYLKKETYIIVNCSLIKAEFVVFYNISYGVPSLSFNMWYSSGELLTLEDIRHLSDNQINQKDFYSVITQQEHPLLHQPCFIMHPCHTEALLAAFKDKSKNIIVTFLGMSVPLLPQLKLRFEYGL